MLHIHRLPLIFAIICIGLSACAEATPIPSTIPLPIETFTSSPVPTETLVPTLTPEPTATPTPEPISEERMYPSTDGGEVGPFTVFFNKTDGVKYIEENVLMQSGNRFKAIDHMTALDNKKAVEYIKGRLLKIKDFIPKYGFASNWDQEEFYCVSVDQGPDNEAFITFVNVDGNYETIIVDNPNNPDDISNFASWTEINQ